MRLRWRLGLAAIVLLAGTAPARAPVRSLALGIDVDCPYGMPG